MPREKCRFSRSALRVFHRATRSSSFQLHASGIFQFYTKRAPSFHLPDSKQGLRRALSCAPTSMRPSPKHLAGPGRASCYCQLERFPKACRFSGRTTDCTVKHISQVDFRLGSNHATNIHMLDQMPVSNFRMPDPGQASKFRLTPRPEETFPVVT